MRFGWCDEPVDLGCKLLSAGHSFAAGVKWYWGGNGQRNGSGRGEVVQVKMAAMARDIGPDPKVN